MRPLALPRPQHDGGGQRDMMMSGSQADGGISGHFNPHSHAPHPHGAGGHGGGGGGRGGGMSGDGEGQGPNRASFHVLEMECPHSKVASVIGTRGVVVKEINRRTGCFISINQAFPDGHPRVITLKGIYDNVMKAKQMILSVIEHGPTALDPQKSFAHSPPTGAGPGPAAHSSMGGTRAAAGVSVSVPCPLDKVGLVIGTRGSVIKEIIRRCNAHIFVAEETIINSNDMCRMIEISGDVGEVDMGKQLVLLVLQHGPGALDWNISPSQSFGNTGSSSNLGLGSRSNSDGFRGGGASSSAATAIGLNAAEFFPASERDRDRRSPFESPSPDITPRDAGGSVSSMTPQGTPGSTPRMNETGASSPVNLDRASSGSPSTGEAVAEVECPFEKVGVLIGFRGVVIKDIMHRSNTVVVIQEESTGGFSRTVEIRGGRANVVHAKILVQAVIEFGASSLTEEISVLTRAINEKHTKQFVPKKAVEILKIEFPDEKIGLMIGSKGSMVKQIMNISGAKVLISDHRSDTDQSYRIVEIKGGADEIKVAKTLIESLINLEPHFQTIGNKNNSRGEYGAPGSDNGGSGNSDQSDLCMEMQLPADKVGLLIGSKGHIIKEIMRHSGARISINADYTDENVRIVLIRGYRDAIVRAHSVMVDVLKNGHSRLFPGVDMSSHTSVASSADGSLDDRSRAGGGGAPPGLEGNILAAAAVRVPAIPVEGRMPFFYNPLAGNMGAEKYSDGEVPCSPSEDRMFSSQLSSGDTMESSLRSNSLGSTLGSTPRAGYSPPGSFVASSLALDSGLSGDVSSLLLSSRGGFGMSSHSFGISNKSDNGGGDSFAGSGNWDSILGSNDNGSMWNITPTMVPGNADGGSSSIYENFLNGDRPRLSPFDMDAAGVGLSDINLSVETPKETHTSNDSSDSALLNFTFVPQPIGGGLSKSPPLGFDALPEKEKPAAAAAAAEITVVIPCPIEKVGQIIGPRGTVIKEIGRRSGSSLSVRNEVSEDGEDVVGQVFIKAKTAESAEFARILVLAVIESGAAALEDVSTTDGGHGLPAAHPNRKAKMTNRPKNMIC
jgi:rRNA processing protein Krr1/Pno1